MQKKAEKKENSSAFTELTWWGENPSSELPGNDLCYEGESRVSGQNVVGNAALLLLLLHVENFRIFQMRTDHGGDGCLLCSQMGMQSRQMDRKVQSSEKGKSWEYERGVP